MQVPEVDVAELAERRAEGAHVLDVREPHEYEEAHVPGAVLIPLKQIPDRAGELDASGATIYVICRSGGRSRRAAEHLRANGFDAINVAGGILAWIDAGHDVTVGSGPG